MLKFIRLSLFSILLALFWLPAAQAQIATLGEAIDKAGAQRMLTQRMVKNYCLLVLEVESKKYTQDMASSLTLYETRLAELKAYASDNKVQQTIAKVEELWPGVKSQASGDVDIDNVETLLADAEALLQASHQVVLALEALSTENTAYLVNISGRQRMLSQRIAGRYMVAALGFDNPEYQQTLNQAAEEFKVALNEMLEAEVNTRPISSRLRNVKTQFKLFELSLQVKNDRYYPAMIAEASEKLLAKMNETTGLYAELLK